MQRRPGVHGGQTLGLERQRPGVQPHHHRRRRSLRRQTVILQARERLHDHRIAIVPGVDRAKLGAPGQPPRPQARAAAEIQHRGGGGLGRPRRDHRHEKIHDLRELHLLRPEAGVAEILPPASLVQKRDVGRAEHLLADLLQSAALQGRVSLREMRHFSD
eukprot:scaffold3144_cov260-Pinguiococcus_pyrenoidosus.AAC.8